MKEYTEEDHKLIKEINEELSPILKKHGKEALQFAAMWMFEKPIAEKKMILKDKKNFVDVKVLSRDFKPMPIYRVPVYPSLSSISLTLDDISKEFKRTDVEFRYIRTRYEKKSCGCVDVFLEYEEI